MEIVLIMFFVLLVSVIFNLIYAYYVDLQHKQIIDLHKRLQKLEEAKEQKELDDYIKEKLEEYTKK